MNPKLPVAPGWGAVAVISAYLTFFPVTINTLRGLQSADPRAVELMRSYAAGRWRDPLEAPRPCVAPVPLHGAQDRGAGGVVGAIIGELPSSIQDGLAGAILNFNQYYVSSPPSLWATNIVAAALGILFFAGRRLAEKLSSSARRSTCA